MSDFNDFNLPTSVQVDNHKAKMWDIGTTTCCPPTGTFPYYLFPACHLKFRVSNEPDKGLAGPNVGNSYMHV